MEHEKSPRQPTISLPFSHSPPPSRPILTPLVRRLFLALLSLLLLPLLYPRLSPPLPRALLARSGPSFTTYLDAHFPRSWTRGHPPDLWLTMADTAWVDTGAAALNEFVERLSGETGRKTRLVVLCLDEECVERCGRRGMWCYGGYQFTRPEQMLVSTWPKVAGLIEVLATRDVFFVDADVTFKLDPYPIMEPLMAAYDIVAQENDSWDHFNTGWMWIRSMSETVAAWQAVLDRDMVKTSRDQNNFNEVLGTAELRLWPDPEQRPLRDEFVSSEGVRVKILPDDLFWSYHFERDRVSAERGNSVYLHLTCGDDMATKVFLTRSLGFWPNLDSYYTSPPRLLTTPSFTGSSSSHTRFLSLLLATSHYLDRALEAPPQAIFTSLPDNRTEARKSWEAYPLARMPGVAEGKGGVREAGYRERAVLELLGRSTLGRGVVREDWKGVEARVVLELLDVVELDIRAVGSFEALLAVLREERYASARVVRLINMDWGREWEEWSIPRADTVKLCESVGQRSKCGAICVGGSGGTGPWEEL